jgi:prepilin-type N-terminal cleavage/methylation domain-containing protein
MKRQGGFTFIELVVSITVGAIVVGITAMFMSSPVDTYFAQARRSEVAATLANVDTNLETDLAKALPNSVRIRNVGPRSIIEMLLVEQTTFIRVAGTIADPDRELQLSNPDRYFAALGRLDPSRTAPYSITNHHFVLNNQGTAAANAYTMTNVITPNNMIFQVLPGAVPDEDRIDLGASFNFSTTAPSGGRLHLVSGPVTYICNSNARTLRRYSNYPITANIPVSEASAQLNQAGVDNALLATNVTTCLTSCTAVAAGQRCLSSIAFEMTVSTPTPRNGAEISRVFVESPVVNVP